MNLYKKIINPIGGMFMGLVFMTSCDPDFVVEQPEQYTKLYMPQAVSASSSHSLVLKDSVQSIVFGAAYGAPYTLGTEINVSFAADLSMVDAYNDANGTSYPALPTESFELSSSSVSIPAGDMASEPLKVNINPINGFDFETQYLLPITITSVDGNITLNEELKTSYFLVEANPPVYEPFIRTGWTIASVSSEETVGEGAGNGHAKHALDGEIGTFWHTQWYGGSPEPPHDIAIDMGESKLISGFSFIQRQNRSTGNVNEIYIELSDDGQNWTQVDIFPGSLPNDNNNNPVFLKSPQTARYFKVTITSTHGDTNFTHLAEIYGF
ncbi:BT_3987 domain-containing protein [Echinicola shivajiensis]|uniref:BT_3987 domain-containing protein n=1 Tax=Echinicola shivajiensis TaxID=1035916 RepID=UPI001BFC73DC|nr:DUF1735 domain-containing protein [Echinicola shivajiensis]